MSYKLCTRCQFVVSSNNKLCTTCGGNKFVACEAPAAHEDEQPIVATIKHTRHIGSASARRYAQATNLTMTEDRHCQVNVAGTHRALRNKFRQLALR